MMGSGADTLGLCNNPIETLGVPSIESQVLLPDQLRKHCSVDTLECHGNDGIALLIALFEFPIHPSARMGVFADEADCDTGPVDFLADAPFNVLSVLTIDRDPK